MAFVVIGAGGFGREVAWTAAEAGLEVAGFCDDDPDAGGRLAHAPFLGAIENAAASLAGGEVSFIVAVGSNKARRDLFKRAEACGWTPRSVVSPHAVIAPDAELAPGCYIGPGAVVSVGARIGSGAIVNNIASIGHDATIGDFAQVCPGAAISGGCVVGTGALIGSCATTIPCVRIGADATLGAGAVAMRDIADGASIVRIRG